MNELYIFCVPGDAYAGKSEAEVAREYKQMAIKDYDEMVDFSESYLPLVETPDLEMRVGQKQGRELMLSLFSQQPMIRVGKVQLPFVSSSYLFNPASEKGLLLPDLDVIQLLGTEVVQAAAEEIERFYQSYGWTAKIVEGAPGLTITVPSESERYQGELEIIDPEGIIDLARHLVDYDPEKLAF